MRKKNKQIFTIIKLKIMLQSFRKVTRSILVKNKKNFNSSTPSLSHVPLVNEANLIHLEEKQKLSISFAQEKHDLSLKFASERHDIMMKFINDKHALSMVSVDNVVCDVHAEASTTIPDNSNTFVSEAPNHDNVVVDADKVNEEDMCFISSVDYRDVDFSVPENATKVVNLIHKYNNLHDGNTLLSLIRGVNKILLYVVDENNLDKPCENLDNAGFGNAIVSVFKNIQNFEPDLYHIVFYCGEIIKLRKPIESFLSPSGYNPKNNSEFYDVLKIILNTAPASSYKNNLRFYLCQVIRALAVDLSGVCHNHSKNRMVNMGFVGLLQKHRNEHNETMTDCALESLGVKEL